MLSIRCISQFFFYFYENLISCDIWIYSEFWHKSICISFITVTTIIIGIIFYHDFLANIIRHIFFISYQSESLVVIFSFWFHSCILHTSLSISYSIFHQYLILSFCKNVYRIISISWISNQFNCQTKLFESFHLYN